MRLWSATAFSAAIIAAVIIAATIPPLAGCSRGAKAPKVLLIGIDGADWRLMRPLMEAGELPNIQRIVAEGSAGTLWSLKPLISPLIWATIATGKGPDQHGILDFVVPDAKSGQMTIVTSQTRRSKAFWNILSEKGVRVCVVGWWATWPAEQINGVMVSDRLSYHAFIKSPEAEAGLVYPDDKRKELLALRMEPAEVPYETARKFIDVSPAEYAAAPALDFYDPISHFRHIYATMTGYERIAENLLRTESPEVMAVYFEGVDTAEHMYMRYEPPPYPSTTADERRKFGRTVQAFYRYQDELLGKLLALTDEKTTVILASDHGFMIGPERPFEPGRNFDYLQAARWHRIEGSFAMKGPNVLRLNDASANTPGLRRASVFDITPTLLALVGLPAGRDMDGRVLSEAFSTDVTVPAPIASYEDDAWRESRASELAASQSIDEEMKEKLRSLGYLGSSDRDAERSLWAQWSLAEYYVFRNRLADARRELDDLRERAPNWPDTYFSLGMLDARAGDFEQARAMFGKVLELKPGDVETSLNLAFVYRQLDQRAAAIGLLEPLAAANPQRPDLRVNLGILYRESGQAERAREMFESALSLDPGSHPAHAQLALLFEETGDKARAVEQWQAALRANPEDRIAQQHLAGLK